MVGFRATRVVITVVCVGGVLGAATGAVAGPHRWSTNGPFGIVARDVAVDPASADVAYVATFGDGVFKSTDRGLHWRASSSGPMAGGDPFQIAIDPSHP